MKAANEVNTMTDEKRAAIKPVKAKAGKSPKLDHIGPASPPGVGPDDSHVLKNEKSGYREISGEELKAARETLVLCLNYWKGKIDSMTKTTEIIDPKTKKVKETIKPVFNQEQYDLLVSRCFQAVRMLLLSLGPVPIGADKAFMKFLLILESYQNRHGRDAKDSNVEVEDKRDLGEKSEEKRIETIQKTLDQMFS